MTTFKRNDTVILNKLPKGFLKELPKDDAKACMRQVGKEVTYLGNFSDNIHEIEFRTDENELHSIFVPLNCLIAPYKKSKCNLLFLSEEDKVLLDKAGEKQLKDICIGRSLKYTPKD